MERIFLLLYGYFRKRRKAFLILLALITALAAFLASGLRFEEDISRMLYGSDSRELSARIVDQSRFLDKIIINVTAEDTSSLPGTEKLASVADRLADTLLSPAFSPWVSALTYKTADTLTSELFNIIYNNLPIFLADEDYLRIDSLLSPSGMEALAGANYRNLLNPTGFVLKQMIVRDPAALATRVMGRIGAYQNDESYVIIDGRIFSRDLSSLLMFVTPVHPSKSTSENAAFVEALDGAVSDIMSPEHAGIRVEYFGTPVVSAANAERLKKDIRLTLSITLMLLALITTFSIRNKKLFPFIFLPAVFGGLMALAVIYLIQAKISVISLSIGTVILAITVDYALHITTHYKHRHSVTQTIRDVSFPIIVCGFATAFEFLALVFVSSESLRELGMLAAISVISASFFTMVVMPHIFDMTKGEHDETEEKNLLERVLDKITAYGFDRNRGLLLFMVVFTVISLFYFRKAGFESDMMKMNYVTPELARAEENLNRINNYKLSSLYVVAYGPSMEEALVSNERVLELAGRLKDEGSVRSYSSPGSVLPSLSLQREKIDRWNRYWTAEKKQTFLQLLDEESIKAGFRGGSFSEFRALMERNFTTMDTITFARLQSLFFVDNISVSGGLTTIVSTLKVDDAGKETVMESFGDSEGVLVIDRKSVLSKLVDNLGSDFNLIANVSLLLILGVLILAFGRFELGFITFVPILVSWVWTLGIMGMAGIKFNIFNIIISSFITGLGIDYSIYIMQGLVQGFETGDRNLLSYKTCILISVMISISGTGVMILARHPALRSIALISIIGLLSVVLISYTFEPVLFNWLVTKRGRQRLLPVTLADVVMTVFTLMLSLAGAILLNAVFLLILLLPVGSRSKKLLVHRSLSFLCRIPVWSMWHVRKRIINDTGEDFSRPAVIVCNHQSHLDLPLLLMQHPKIIVLTNRWVWNNPVYALVIRYLDYYPVSQGYESIIARLKERVADGYSVLIFPEGSRSPDARIRRFHKGAFLLAGRLNLDMLPLMVHGTGDCMTKGENHIRKGTVTLKFNPRIRPGDPAYGADYHQRTRNMLTFYRSEYEKLRAELETPRYFRNRLIRNFIYKGPVLEWYCRIKMLLERDYSLINSYVPREADITDLGCGYGFADYMLSFVSEKRKITGIDYDEEKIRLAGRCISMNDRLSFICADVTTYPFGNSDVFILGDVLHYLTEADREKVLCRCIRNLNPGGVIIIRDADSDLRRRHLFTRYTEFFSTRMGYNKTEGKGLFFFSGASLRALAEKSGMELEIPDSGRITSNRYYLIRHKK